MKEFFNDFKSKIQVPANEKTAEQKQQEINKMFALALADQDRRLLELSGGADNG